MSSTTPNMGLIIPDPGVTPGPAWASELNTALEDVDSHDHTPGSGVLIPTAALNINGDLSFNTYNLLDLNSIVLTSRVSNVTSGTSVYVKNGELFYIDDAANVTQITDNGSVAGATGTIGGMGSVPPDINPSASFSDSNLDFSFNHDSGRPAKLNISDVRLFPFTQDPAAAASDYVTLKSPAALSAQYSWIFPLALPSKTSPLIWSGAGVVDDVELNNGQFLIGSTAGAVAAGTIAAVADQTVVTPTANGITVGTVQSIGTTSSPTFAALTTTSGLLIPDGTVAAPAIRFTGDTNTGLFRVTTDQVALVAGGTARITANTTGAAVTGALTVTGAITATTDVTATDDIIAGDSFYGSLGAEGSPTYSFTGDADTGMWSSTAGAINMSSNGTEVMELGTGGMNITVPLYVPDGTAASPRIAFSLDGDTGIYRAGTNLLGFTAQGVPCATIGTVGISIQNFGYLQLTHGSQVRYHGSISGDALGAYVTKIRVSVNGNTYYIPAYL